MAYGPDLGDLLLSATGITATGNADVDMGCGMITNSTSLTAAVATGAEVLHEPRLWPEYHETYYGAFVRDPDGNNVEAVCHAPE